jgi:DDE superfamily endonuclease
VCREVQTPRDGRKLPPPCWPAGPERPLHRPAAPEAQQESDRGQKKGPTLQNLLVLEEPCQIGFLRATSAGKGHDTSLAERAGYPVPPGSGLSQDLGFQGDTCAGIPLVQPKQKPPGGELTPAAKAAHRAISSIRIRIEPAMGGVKRSRLVKDKRRLLKDGIRDTLMETGGGLHNFRRPYRPWN